jgi:uncharacterized membrane protein YphA (DoxX/SURF4 family)
LRAGVGAVFLLFGIGKFLGDGWADTMRSMEFFKTLPWSVDVSISISGFLEIATGAGLVLGAWTSFWALAAAAQLIAILWLLAGLGIHEWRDIGLLAACLALFFRQEDFFSFDSLRRRVREEL